MLILIAGKPNSGKTYCIQHLQKKYEHIFIADQYVNEIYQVNQIGYNLIKQHFGHEFVNDTCVDKKRLGELIINEDSKSQLLSDLIWPLLRDKILELKHTKLNYIVELAIYDVDFNNIFKDLFDVTIQIIPTAKVENDKAKFAKLYASSNKQYDYVVTNHNDSIYIEEISKIIDSYFVLDK